MPYNPETDEIDVLPSVYWTEEGDTSGYYGLHNDGFQSWINAYKPDGTFVASISRCFDYEGAVTELQNDPKVTILKNEEVPNENNQSSPN